MIVAEFVYIATMLIIWYFVIRNIIYMARNWDVEDANEEWLVATFFITFLVLVPVVIAMTGWFIVVKWGAAIAESFVNLMEIEM